AQIERYTFSISQRLKHVSDIEANVDGLLERINALRQLCQCFESLFKKDHRLRIGLSICSLRACLTQVYDRLIRKLAAERMICQPFDLFANAAGIQGFDRIHDALMYFAP